MKIAIIPARGGSKRIPRKNIKPFLGKPIMAYSIEAARASGLFDHVIVSTDDEEIAQVARDYGAETPFRRPAELAGDHTITVAVVKHGVEWVIDHLGQVDLVCCIYATAPFVQVHYLREGHDRLLASNKPYAFSVTTFPFPIQRAVRITVEGCVEARHPEYMYTRSQDLEKTYHDAGQFYWGRTKSFLDEHAIFTSCSLPVILPRHLVQDIDTEEDWRRAELMFRAWHMEEAIS